MQTCSNKDLKNPQYVGYENKTIGTGFDKSKSEILKQESTLNGYEFVYSIFKSNGAILPVYLIVISVFLTVLFSFICIMFYEKKLLFFLNLINLLFFFSSLYYFWKYSILKECSQIKIGTYLYLLNTFIINILLGKSLFFKESKNNIQLREE